MNEILKNLLIQTGAYTTVFLSSIFLFNWLSNGFLWTYLRIKASRGKKTLLRMHGTTGRYYLQSKIYDRLIHFKDRQKHAWALRIRPDQVTREMGVNTVDVDEDTAQILAPDFKSAAPGHDATIFDGLLKRAMQSPTLAPSIKDIIIILLLVLNLAATIFIYVTVRKLAETIAGLNVIGVVQ